MSLRDECRKRAWEWFEHANHLSAQERAAALDIAKVWVRLAMDVHADQAEQRANFGKRKVGVASLSIRLHLLSRQSRRAKQAQRVASAHVG